VHHVLRAAQKRPVLHLGAHHHEILKQSNAVSGVMFRPAQPCSCHGCRPGHCSESQSLVWSAAQSARLQPRAMDRCGSVCKCLLVPMPIGGMVSMLMLTCMVWLAAAAGHASTGWCNSQTVQQPHWLVHNCDTAGTGAQRGGSCTLLGMPPPSTRRAASTPSAMRLLNGILLRVSPRTALQFQAADQGHEETAIL
jgi:hypothetical protein